MAASASVSASKTRKKAILVLFIWAVAMLFFMAALHPNVLTAADQVFCMCCADRRECEQDPTCCNDGCCRIRP